MKALLAALLVVSPAAAAPPPPVIDMHMHAMGAADEGPPPMGMCTPIEPFPVWDQRRPYEEIFVERFKKPPCSDPVWSPMTDSALRDETIAAMRKLNIYGVLSGPPERVAEWRRAAPGRFWPGLDFSLGRDYSPDRLRALHRAGDLAVLAEITIQYEGIEPSHPRLEPV